MGRPLHKKYFGNRNLGTASTADDGLGGNRVASVTLTNQGSYTTRPTVTFSAPDLAGPGGVTATGTTLMEGNTVAVTTGQGGTTYVIGDLLTITGAGGAIARVTSVDGVTGAVTGVAFTGTGAARGEQTALTGITSAVATTTNSVAGSGAQVDVTYRVKSITITNSGSGYTDAADAAVTFSAGTAAGTTVLESYSLGGAIGNNENAIVAYAYVTGGSRKIGDIVKQVGSRRFKVKTADGTEVCTLVTDGVANAASEMNITATDSSGKTYYVSKIASRKATLVRYGAAGHEFADGASVAWTFDAPTLNVNVQIENK